MTIAEFEFSSGETLQHYAEEKIKPFLETFDNITYDKKVTSNDVDFYYFNISNFPHIRLGIVSDGNNNELRLFLQDKSESDGSTNIFYYFGAIFNVNYPGNYLKIAIISKQENIIALDAQTINYSFSSFIALDTGHDGYSYLYYPYNNSFYVIKDKASELILDTYNIDPYNFGGMVQSNKVMMYKTPVKSSAGVVDLFTDLYFMYNTQEFNTMRFAKIMVNGVKYIQIADGCLFIKDDVDTSGGE